MNNEDQNQANNDPKDFLHVVLLSALPNDSALLRRGQVRPPQSSIKIIARRPSRFGLVGSKRLLERTYFRVPRMYRQARNPAKQKAMTDAVRNG